MADFAAVVCRLLGTRAADRAAPDWRSNLSAGAGKREMILRLKGVPLLKTLHLVPTLTRLSVHSAPPPIF